MRTVITSSPDSVITSLKKVWSFRALIVVFAIRDLKVKYAQTQLGIIWSFLQPLTALIIYTAFFELLLNMSVRDLPYTVHVLSGLLGWNYFTHVFISGSNSIQESSHLIKKIYFPKGILPLSKVIVASIEMFFSILILIPLVIYFKVSISWNVLLFPLVWFYNTICGLALVYWLGAFAIKKRDFYHIVPFVVYFGIWLTPVFFSGDILPDSVSWLLDYNPMANVLDLWRWSLFGVGEMSPIYGLNLLIMMGFCALGYYLFSRAEGLLSDFA